MHDSTNVNDNSNSDSPAAPAVIIREGKAEDYPLLFDSLFRVYGQSRDSWYGRNTPHRILKGKLEQLLEAPGWRCIVACPNHDVDEIMGMLVYAPPNERTKNFQIGWIVTKGPYHKHGVAKALLKHAQINLQTNVVDCAFMMPKVQQWANQRGYKLLFKPYIPDVALWNTLLGKQRGVSHDE